MTKYPITLCYRSPCVSYRSRGKGLTCPHIKLMLLSDIGEEIEGLTSSEQTWVKSGHGWVTGGSEVRSVCQLNSVIQTTAECLNCCFIEVSLRFFQ